MDTQGCNRRLLVLAIVVCFAAGQTAHVAANDKEKQRLNTKTKSHPRDVLTLLEQGVIDVGLEAHGAYRLDIKVWNLTDKTVDVAFPPGLVADAFGQNEVLAQIGGGLGGSSSGSSGGSGGSQGLGLLNTPVERVAANQAVMFTMRTICLNFGLPEPNPRSPLFLKRVDEYTSNVKVRELLTRLAKAEAPSNIAQYALWHHTNGLSWAQLARIAGRMKQRASGDDLAEAKRWTESKENVDIADSASDPASKASDETVDKPSSAETFAVALQINPDPRGGSAAGVTRALASYLRAKMPGFGVSHGNALPRDGNSATTTCWQMLLKAPPAKISSDDKLVYNKPLTITMVRADWDDKKGRWRREKTRSIKIAAEAANNPSEVAEVVGRQLMGEIASQAVTASYSAGKKELTFVNTLPVVVTVHQVKPRRDSKTPTKLEGVLVPSLGRRTVPVADHMHHEPGQTLNPSVVGIALRAG